VESDPADPGTYFAGLASSGRLALLEDASGTIRIDVERDQRPQQHWYLTLDKGALSVAEKDEPADAVVHVDEATIQGITAGTTNAMTAALRGTLVPEGDIGLVMVLQRVFPGPPGAVGPATPARQGTARQGTARQGTARQGVAR
jgi:hypothetical protein